MPSAVYADATLEDVGGAPLPVDFDQSPPAQDPVRGKLPLGTRAEFLSILSRYSCSDVSAQTAREIAQSVAPTAGSSAVPAATPVEQQPTAVPTVPPQYFPTPRPANGIGSLMAPTPMPTGTVVTPPPIPTPTPVPTVSLGPVYLIRNGTPPPITPKGAPTATASGTPQPSPTPVNAPTLGPDEYAILADSLQGSTNPGVPGDAVGNVHLYYSEGVVVADRAHFNGDHTITLTGHPYIINRAQDTVLYADSIVFDTVTQRARLVGGRGATVEGVQEGELYYTARTLTSTRTEVHGDHASFTTCLNPHGGYHIEARNFDMTPGQRLIAHDAVVFLGPLAIFFIPFLVIPLHQDTVEVPQHSTPILPEMGHDPINGYYIKTRFGFGRTYYYYGDYRLEYYSNRGLGLGYDGYINSRNRKRQLQISFWTMKDRTENDTRTSTLNLNDIENFSNNFHVNLNGYYNNYYGPYVTSPAQLSLNTSINTNGTRSSESLSYNTNSYGADNQSSGITYTQNLQLSQQLRQAFNLAYNKSITSVGDDDTLHINSQTSYMTPSANYLFTINKTDQTEQAIGYDTVPELQITPNINFHQFRFPFTTQFTYGYYTEPENNFSTERGDIKFNWPFTFNIFHTSLFTAAENIDQDLYGTGDAKAAVNETASLETAVGTHIVNTMQYNDAYPIGPADVPFETQDRLAGAYKEGQDTIRFFNDDTYMLTLSDGTTFDRMAQPVQYELDLRPSHRAYLVFTGSWIPGSGNGFDLTNAQVMTGLGHSGELQFTTNLDWKNKGRLEDKNIYYRITVDDCYQIVTSYTQLTGAFNLGFNLLAFPSHGASFGLGGINTSGTNNGILQQVENNIPL
ncbi:MAG TPA: hypothetical protein VME66_11355 [Candidatus Acidoferrales bacterium]|nr:hypothetical protein [Candidatus Acidoferrales bacterium]